MSSDNPQNPWVIASHLTWDSHLTPSETKHLPTAIENSSEGSRSRGGDYLSLGDISAKNNPPEAIQRQESRLYRCEAPHSSYQSFQENSKTNLRQSSRKRRQRRRQKRQPNQTVPPHFSSTATMSEKEQHPPLPTSMPRTFDNLINPSSIRNLFPHLAKNLSDAEMEQKMRLCEQYRDDSYTFEEAKERSRKQDAHHAEHRQD